MSKKEGKRIVSKAPKAENILQAVLFADSFTRKLFPVSSEKPKALMPLANVPMIEYALETLAASDVREVLVVCCSHADQITSYLQQSKWSAEKTNDYARTKVKTFTINDAFSEGDALRRIFQLQLVRSEPFVIMSGDCITNLNLKSMLISHTMAKEADKSFIMSVLMTPKHRNFDELVISLSSSGELLLYEEGDDAVVELDIALCLENEQEIRYDLVDGHTYVCSQEV